MHRIKAQGLVIVVSAPSGGGKTTLCTQLTATDPNVIRAVTCTTRPPRTGEQNGRDYYFLKPEEFQAKVAAGEFLEHATVYNNSYGTLSQEILSKLQQGKDVLLSVDVQGATAIRTGAASNPELKRALVSIFIAPKSLPVLEERLRGRGTDSEAVILTRLSLARQEISQALYFDYVIVSSSMEADFAQLRAILAAEKLRNFRSQLPDYR